MFAFFCLPRMFHIGVVECADVADVRRARWWFGGYLVLLSIVVIPIVAASLPLDAAGRGAPSTDALGVVVAAVGGPGMAGTAGVSRRIFGGHRHGHRGERCAVDHDQQRPGAADAVALAGYRLGNGVSSGHPLGATRCHRRSVVRRLRILPPRAECAEPGVHRHAGARRSRAVRARDHRGGLLAGREPRRRHRRARDRLRHLDLHAADSRHRLGRRHAACLAHRRTVRTRVAQAGRAVRDRIPRGAIARRRLVAGCERCSAGGIVVAISARDWRAAARRGPPAARGLFKDRGQRARRAGAAGRRDSRRPVAARRKIVRRAGRATIARAACARAASPRVRRGARRFRIAAVAGARPVGRARRFLGAPGAHQRAAWRRESNSRKSSPCSTRRRANCASIANCSKP